MHFHHSSVWKKIQHFCICSILWPSSSKKKFAVEWMQLSQVFVSQQSKNIKIVEKIWCGNRFTDDLTKPNCIMYTPLWTMNEGYSSVFISKWMKTAPTQKAWAITNCWMGHCTWNNDEKDNSTAPFCLRWDRKKNTKPSDPLEMEKELNSATLARYRFYFSVCKSMCVEGAQQQQQQIIAVHSWIEHERFAYIVAFFSALFRVFLRFHSSNTIIISRFAWAFVISWPKSKKSRRHPGRTNNGNVFNFIRFGLFVLQRKWKIFRRWNDFLSNKKEINNKDVESSDKRWQLLLFATVYALFIIFNKDRNNADLVFERVSVEFMKSAELSAEYLQNYTNKILANPVSCQSW